MPSVSEQGSGRLSRPAEIVLVALVLVLAGALRMAAPGLTEFKADEARLLGLALDMAQGQGFALRGISTSVGLPNFPASVWVYALPVALWPHPYAATLFTGLLATLAVAACYWFVRRYWGTCAALAAALLYTVSPWAVIFSRKIWAQDLLPLFVMGWVIAAALAFVEARQRFLWLHLICLALAVQIHLAAVALVPATAIMLLVFRRRVRWTDLVIGSALAALTAVPFLLYVWRDRGAATLPTSVATGSAGGLSLASLRHTRDISLGRGVHALAGGDAYEAFLAGVPDLTLVQVLLATLILGGALLLAWDAWRSWTQPQAQVGLIILLWLGTPALFFLWPVTPIYLHYFIAALPAPFIAAGVGAAALPQVFARGLPTAERRLRVITTTLVALIALFQAYVLISLLAFLGRTATPGGFGTPLTFKLEAAGAARALMAETGAMEVLLAGDGEAPLVDEFPAEWSVLLRDTPHRFVDVNRSALFPEQRAVVLLDGRAPSPTWTGDLYQTAATATQDIALRSGEGIYQVLALPAAARPAPQQAVDPPYLLANWVNLLGVDAPRRLDNETAVWQIHWRTGDNPDPATYHFFNHLQDGAGGRLGQADEPAFTPGQWREGDSVISRFLLPWPPTAMPPLTVHVGMYRYPFLENVPLLDVAGNPYQDAAEFAVPDLPAE